MLTKNHDQLTIEVKRHIEADALVQGIYWDGSRGCFIGCLAHSPDASVLGDRFGLPQPLVRICENIFESLEPDDAKAFFAAIPEAVGRNNKDLTLVHWAFLASELRALPGVFGKVQAVIDPVIEGVDLLADGREWSDAAARAARAAAYAAYAATYATYAAARAAGAAYAARAAARAAAYAAADAAGAADAARAAAYAAYAAADADYAATRVRQRDTILKLISQAPVML